MWAFYSVIMCRVLSDYRSTGKSASSNHGTTLEEFTSEQVEHLGPKVPRTHSSVMAATQASRK
jgi:hypothetical protein